MTKRWSSYSQKEMILVLQLKEAETGLLDTVKEELQFIINFRESVKPGDAMESMTEL